MAIELSRKPLTQPPSLAPTNKTYKVSVSGDGNYWEDIGYAATLDEGVELAYSYEERYYIRITSMS